MSLFIAPEVTHEFVILGVDLLHDFLNLPGILPEPARVLARTEIVGSLLGVVGVEIGEFFDLREVVLMQNFVIIALCEITFEFHRKFAHFRSSFWECAMSLAKGKLTICYCVLKHVRGEFLVDQRHVRSRSATCVFW